MRFNSLHLAIVWLGLIPLGLWAGPLPKWIPVGPAPTTGGQTEGMVDREVSGAVNALAPHPTDATILFIGAVNGGVWRTSNAMDARPTWSQLTDGQGSLSIGALEFDPTDSTHRTLIAGSGRFSSYYREGGARIGVLRTVDEGKTWTVHDGGGTLLNLNIAGVAARGKTLVLAANQADTTSRQGVWRSVNGGANWTQISGAAGTGLPAGATFTLAGTSARRDRLFVNAGGGLYRSDDIGGTWTKVSNAAMDGMLSGATNVKVATGSEDVVFVGIVRFGRLAQVYRSANGGTTWTELGIPTIGAIGTHPGGQGEIHFSLAADPGAPNIVYVGGDRQDRPFPNGIGARDYSGALFRGDASKPAGERWVHLTHSRTLGPSGGGTVNSSAPHADSRAMRMAANGTLLEADDGGVYRRTNPRTNAGDWFSANGNLQVAEFHSVAWDRLAKVVIGGAQDTGTPEQILTADGRWRSVSTGDGGVVAVDNLGTTGRSVRYSSYQNLLGLRRRVYDAANVLQSEVSPTLIVISGEPLGKQFYTPLRVNAVQGSRLIIGGSNSVYESLDQGDTLTEIGAGIAANSTGQGSIAYGATGNADALYVGASSAVYVRASVTDGLNRSNYGGGYVRGLTMDVSTFRTAFVVDTSSVYRTTDAGDNWTDVTGNLATLRPGALRSVVFIGGSTPSLAVGADRGVFVASGPGFTNWSVMGTGLPRSPVLQLEYHPSEKRLLAGTLGRGAWTAILESDSILAVRTVAPPPATPLGTAPASEPENAVTLIPGVIVDPRRGQAYIMSPAGSIEALSLERGERVWDSEAAARPLSVVANRLVAQGESSGEGRGVPLVSLEPATGKRVTGGLLSIPPGITASINETARGTFVTQVRAVEGEPIVSWEFFERTTRALPPGTIDEGLPPGAVRALPGARRGTVRLNLSTGAVTPVEGADVALRRAPSAMMTPAAQRVPDVKGQQFLSVDGRHILVSEREGDDRVWERYRLSVHERFTGKRLGQWMSHLPYVPFTVDGSRVHFVTGGFTRREGGRLIDEPQKLRVVDLTRGRLIWSRAVRDTAFTGPLPP